MRFSISILLSLIAISIVTTSPTGVNQSCPNLRELKSFLDWSQEFNRISQIEKDVYNEFWDRVTTAAGLEDVKHIFLDTFEFISKSAELRDFLVREGASGGSAGERISGDSSAVISVIITMKDVFDDLKSHISEWEKVKEGDAPIEKVTDPEPLNWFKEHGFDESSLNDVTIEQLKTAVEGIVGEGNTLDRLSKFVALSFFDLSTMDLCTNLTLLFATIGGAQYVLQIDKHIKEEYKVFRIASLHEVLNIFRDMGIEDEALQFFVGQEVHRPSWPDVISLFNNEYAYDNRTGTLVTLLKFLGEYVPKQMEMLEAFLRISCDENLDSSSGDSSRALVPSCESRKRTADQIRETLSEEGEVTAACDLLRRCLEILGHGRPPMSEVREFLRKRRL